MIKGNMINLRMIRQSDLDEIISAKNDLLEKGEYWPLSLHNEVDYRRRYSETGFWNESYGALLITNKNDRILGEITYFKGLWYMPGYEIGYQIFRRDDRGKGYTAEALRLFCAYLFEATKINRLEIEVDEGNIASRRVAEKCGFKFEGLKRQASFTNGKYADIELLSLLREECPLLSDIAGK